MKTKIKIATFIVGFALCFASCTTYDAIGGLNGKGGIAIPGQMAPTVYWELASSSIAAGEDVEFKAQYYTNREGATIDHLEAWYCIDEVTNTSVKCPLITKSFVISTNVSEKTRDYEKVAVYAHNPAKWDKDKKSFPLDTTFATSKTLANISWVLPEQWDNNKFAEFFPETLPQVFKDSLYKVCGYAEFRSLLIGLGLMDGTRFEGIKDSTLDENSGTYIFSIKTDSMPTVKAMYDGVDFKDLIYNTSEGKFAIEYTKSYKLTADLRAVDNLGTIGVTEKKEIELR